MARMYDYLYTIECCGFDVAIYAGTDSQCPGCYSLFTPTLEVPEDATRVAKRSCTHMPSMFDGLTMAEAIALRTKLHSARDELKFTRNGARMLVKEMDRGPVRDRIRHNLYGYSEIMVEVSDLALELFMANLA
jgi:hypothetical protein